MEFSFLKRNPEDSPKTVGMSSGKLSLVNEAMNELLQNKMFSGAVVVISKKR